MSSAVDLELARISQRVRRSREDAGLTLQELAQKSGVATSTIQKVETERMIPSVAVILKIARGLDLGVAELVRDNDDDTEAVHLPAAGRQSLGSAGRLTAERLSGDLLEPTLEMWRVTLHPGASSGRSPIRYDGEELVVCEDGALTVRLADDEYDLSTGDSLHFKASLPHSWRNDTSRLARFTITGTLPRKLRAALRRRAARG
jgi:transcriptional regulator with XRE-family HTH domain